MQPLPDVTCFFHPVLPARALRDRPVRVELGGQAYALFRDASGTPSALLDRCPHRFAPLSRGHVRKDGRLQCPYHGWRFDGRGRGESPTQPSLKHCNVVSLQVVERWDYLWVAAPSVPLDAFPQFDADGYTFNGTFSVPFAAPLHVVLDNFSEDEHTPFVHTRLGWDEPVASTVDFEAENHDDRTEVVYRAPQRRSRLTPLLLLRDGDTFHNEWTTRFDPVRTDYRIHWTAPDGRPRPFLNRAVIFMVPETERTTRLHVFSFIRLADRRFAPLLPMLRRAALVLSRFEVLDDARFIPTVAETPYAFRGMRLGKFDKPLIHNRKLLDRIYFRREPVKSEVAPVQVGLIETSR